MILVILYYKVAHTPGTCLLPRADRRNNGDLVALLDHQRCSSSRTSSAFPFPFRSSTSSRDIYILEIHSHKTRRQNPVLDPRVPLLEHVKQPVQLKRRGKGLVLEASEGPGARKVQHVEVALWRSGRGGRHDEFFVLRENCSLSLSGEGG